MVVKGQRGESCSADAPLRLLHLDGGVQTRCQGHLSVSLSLDTHGGSPATRLQGAHTTRSGSDS